MRNWVVRTLVVAGLFSAGNGLVAAETPSGPTVVIPLREQVSKAQFMFLRRALKEAERNEAGAIILHMDTPGGELQAAVDMVDALQKMSVPTYTFIDKNAASAGALISLATDHIYMAPVSAIGAAAPVTGGGQDVPETMNDKVVSYYSKYFRGAAEVSGHNPDLAEAFINKKKEVKIGDHVVSEKDDLLTLSPQEAIQEFDGKPLLAAGIAKDLDDVVKQANLNPTIQMLEPTGMESLALLITALAPVFLFGGIIGAYIEFKTPGFGVPGILGGICFLIFFTGHYVAGLAGHEELVIFVLGVLFIFVELFLFPGTIVFGVLGFLMMMGALFWAMVDTYPAQGWSFSVPDSSALLGPLLNLVIAGVAGVVAILILAKFLPRTSLFKRIVLGKAITGGAALQTDERPGEALARAVVGMEGAAVTSLRPSGKAVFGDLYLDVVTEGDFLAADTKVRIATSEGSRVVVAKSE